MFRYRWPSGMWAFVLHRLTGVLFTGYLLTHILVMSYLARGPQAFNKLMHFLTSPLFRVGEVGLLALILFHLLNGLRIICFDWIDAFRYQKAFFYGLMILTFIMFLFGAYPLLPKEWIGGPAR